VLSTQRAAHGSVALISTVGGSRNATHNSARHRIPVNPCPPMRQS